MKEEQRIPVIIGFDTSNYRTSVAAVALDGGILVNFRELLPVPPGERGLRQSEAVFAHIRQLNSCEALLREKADNMRICAVAVSSRPRDGEESYMPVFLVGEMAGNILAASLGVPFFRTTHQNGHLSAAAVGTSLAERENCLAFHLSGGTTDLLYLRGESTERIGGGADLHAGQLVDRCGVAMGLPFPSGPALEELAANGRSEGRLGCSLDRGDLICHLSGAETQAQRWIREGVMPREDIAREIYDLLARTFARMLKSGAQKTGEREALVMGGIASSALFRELLRERCEKTRGAPRPVFGSPELSGDNAVGVAMIGRRKYREGSYGS